MLWHILMSVRYTPRTCEKRQVCFGTSAVSAQKNLRRLH